MNTLPSVYLGNIRYYSLLLNEQVSHIELYEHFVKQSYRSRADIYGANGKLSLIVPLKKRLKHTPMKDVEICYRESWQTLHIKSLQSAYRSSAYFEYYEDDIRPLYEIKYEYLIDLNAAFQSTILSLLGIENELIPTTEYIVQDPDKDLRLLFHPRKSEHTPTFDTYYQVFEQKNGFLPNLCILDLLFNEGPNAINYLKKQIHQFPKGN